MARTLALDIEALERPILTELERREETPKEVFQPWQRWAAHDTIAAAMYVFARHTNDFCAAVLEAANTPGDSDSIATLAGALCGAALGQRVVPAAWVSDLERSDELAHLAQLVFRV